MSLSPLFAGLALDPVSAEPMEALVERIRQCPNLPSLPSIAMQILDLAQKADVDIPEIARIISKDAALSGKILRTVNSSFYGRSQHVSTISHALVILGLQSVKTLVLGFSLVTSLTKNKTKGFKHLAYWKRSIYSATAARTIAARVSIVQQEEAFLASLLMDIGMLVLDAVLGEQYDQISSTVACHADLSAAEKKALGMTHAEVGRFLATQWKLPPLLCVPIASHHSPDDVKDAALRKLTEIVQLSGLCADVYVEENAASSIAEVRKTCAQRFNMKESECDALLAEIGTRTREVASLFEINIGAYTDFESILRKANEALVELVLQSQRQASTLQEQNTRLRVVATTDGLTGLANRARLEEFIHEQFDAATRSGKCLSLIMIDVDKFKFINDKFGHPGGDQVLCVLGKLLQTAARKTDLAGRYGGEELVLCLPNTNRATAAAIAETLRKAIAAKPVQQAGQMIPVTASFGVAAVEPGVSFAQPAQLIKAADLALYHAKHSGRNCVKIFASKSQSKPAAA
jgi:diguanylate cyclase (GGDEF)-like protein